ncbi:hypothetical protein [Phenylobacterium sp.]|uniref:hypothetical protein n=1 Tax=Phenylobacterium sp. TaxID=1871053 RepID=UPI0012063A21|nr:hypothetical protein [Phenylobacterium sp.]THD57457.1 MAG: hypothetical protein E8A49_22700 [Phenylobacterium sp.]
MTLTDFIGYSERNRQELYTAVWNKLASLDGEMIPYSNLLEVPLDQGKLLIVSRQQDEHGDPTDFLRRIVRQDGGEAKTAAKLAEDRDANGVSRRIGQIELPAFVPFLDATEHPPTIFYDIYGRAASRLQTFDRKGFKHIDKASAEVVVLAIQLYHELQHLRLRFESSARWPVATRRFLPAFLDWTEPSDPAYQKVKAEMVNAHGRDTIQKVLEEKFVINQAAGQFKEFVYNEEIADKYAKSDEFPGVSAEGMVKLFDALDRAHKLPVSERPTNVNIGDFVRGVHKGKIVPPDAWRGVQTTLPPELCAPPSPAARNKSKSAKPPTPGGGKRKRSDVTPGPTDTTTDTAMAAQDTNPARRASRIAAWGSPPDNLPISRPSIFQGWPILSQLGQIFRSGPTAAPVMPTAGAWEPPNLQRASVGGGWPFLPVGAPSDDPPRDPGAAWDGPVYGQTGGGGTGIAFGSPPGGDGLGWRGGFPTGGGIDDDPGGPVEPPPVEPPISISPPDPVINLPIYRGGSSGQPVEEPPEPAPPIEEAPVYRPPPPPVEPPPAFSAPFVPSPPPEPYESPFTQPLAPSGPPTGGFEYPEG